jgi:CRISPR-associated endonuclease/helicase Cas3
LDSTLKRQQPDAVFELPTIRARLDGSAAEDHLFIVLGSPVTEVGRDHDYDWAIVEPSSVRSLIQLLGRVRRHREGDCGPPNVHVFSSNLRHFRRPGKAAFCRPGFERDSGPFRLRSHDLGNLLDAEELAGMDARPRITAPAAADLRPQERLSHLEHARLQAELLPPVDSAPAATGRHARGPGAASVPATLNASSWWHAAPADALLGGLITQAQPFRDDAGQQEVSLVLLPNEEDEGGAPQLHWIMDIRQGRNQKTTYLAVQIGLHTPLDDRLVSGPGICPWGVTDYLQELSELAESLDLPLRRCAEKFGTVHVPEHDGGWRSHAVLGFSKRR